MLAPFGVKNCTRCLAESSSSLRKKFAKFWFFFEIFEKTCFLLDFLCISQMCIFHEKIITFLFVTLSHMIWFSSIFYRRREIQLPYWICTLKCQLTPFPRIFSLKTWNFHCTRTSKNWKIHDFFVFLVLSSYCFLRVKSCVEHVFVGFRAIRCRKRTFFDDLELKKQLFYGKICTLLFVTLSHMIGLSSIF